MMTAQTATVYLEMSAAVTAVSDARRALDRAARVLEDHRATREADLLRTSSRVLLREAEILVERRNALP